MPLTNNAATPRIYSINEHLLNSYTWDALPYCYISNKKKAVVSLSPTSHNTKYFAHLIMT